MEARRKYPDAEWMELSGIMVADARMEKSRKSKNERKKFESEIGIAETLVKANHSVYLLPEDSGGGKKPDAIVDGLYFDFKKIKFSQLEKRILEGLEQAQNLCIKIDDSNVTLSRILGKIYKHKYKNAGILFIILNGVLHKVTLK